MSPLVSRIGPALNKGSNEHRKWSRAAHGRLHAQAGSKTAGALERGYNGHERGLSRADAGKWDASPRVVRTPNQDALGSASPDGVERAAPDQGQAELEGRTGGQPWCRPGPVKAEAGVAVSGFTHRERSPRRPVRRSSESAGERRGWLVASSRPDGGRSLNGGTSRNRGDNFAQDRRLRTHVRNFLGKKFPIPTTACAAFRRKPLRKFVQVILLGPG